ncbi:hypothetical protein GMD78_05785 [Ornithinibacillus sp. L9]|uniref:OmpR/PhoB-type domain-containing protein n=1 Tax=Ornithinibacillus caprae TaxID=2678566 RepID=A0A6N8FJH7_9BACI|nr:winged helix-turn-helix domain-containing protein [Ornithinibacillus caprae]MUK87909.1 hypothetical protein [Ornithinibacillus caprae]
MIFSQEDYSVTCDEEKVVLLRKEYLLLLFLYKNKGIAFSREDILNAVWPLEDPTDRTVDDHIYRLRKKLSPFCEKVSIKTVKGFGYLLAVDEKRQPSPVPMPEELFEQANHLFNMYYKYGHGKALKELITNKELGFSLNEKYETVLYLLQSDFTSLLQKMDSSNNKFIPLYLYANIEEDTEQVISIYEKVIRSKVLVEEQQMDIEYFSLPMLYMKVDKPNESMKIVHKGLNEIKFDDKHGFFPLLNIMKTIILLFTYEIAKTKDEIAAIENLLALHPYQREQGVLHVIKGLILIAEGKSAKGKDLIEEGRTIIIQSGHSYYFLFIYQVLDLVLAKLGVDVDTINFYEREKSKYYKKANLWNLKEVISDQVRKFL